MTQQDSAGHTEAGIDVEAWRQRIRADAFGRYHYEMGIAIRAEGNLPAAVQHLQTAIDTDPTLVDACYALGQIHESQGRPAEAESLYTRARAHDPGFPAATLIRLALRTLDHPGEGEGEEDALALVAQAQNHEPAQPIALGIKALILARHGRLDEAQTLWSGIDLSRNGDGEAAAGLAWRFYRLAENMKAGGHKDDARFLADCALMLDPDLPQALGLSGLLLLEDGRAEEAEAALRRAVTVQPGTPWLRALLGHILATRGIYGEAVEFLRSAASESFGNDAWVFGQLGMALAMTGPHEEAVSMLQKSLNLKPGAVDILGYLGHSLLALGRTGEAAAVLESTLRHSPGDGWLLRLLASTRQREGRFGDAAALYRQALEHIPDSGETLLELGNTLFMAGRLEEAEETLTETGRRFPDLDSQGPLGLVLLARHRGSDAAQAFRRALDRHPAQPWLHEGLAAALLMAGDTAAAADAFAAGWAVGMEPVTTFARLWLSMTPAEVTEGLSALAAAQPAGWPLQLLGLAHLAGGNAAAAVEALSESTARSPADANGWVLLGLARIIAGDAAAGLAAIDQGLERDPAPRHRTYRGLALQALNRLDEADAEHSATLEAIPGHTAGRLHRALTLHAQGKTDEARALLRLAMGEFPGRVRVQRRLLPPWAAPVLEGLEAG